MTSTLFENQGVTAHESETVHGNEMVHGNVLEGFLLEEETVNEQMMEMEYGRLQVILSYES